MRHRIGKILITGMMTFSMLAGSLPVQAFSDITVPETTVAETESAIPEAESTETTEESSAAESESTVLETFTPVLPDPEPIEETVIPPVTEPPVVKPPVITVGPAEPITAVPVEMPLDTDPINDDNFWDDLLKRLSGLTSSEKEEEDTVSANNLSVYYAKDVAEYTAAVKVLDDTSDLRLIVNTSSDLSFCTVPGKAVYYDGMYLAAFASYADRNAAYTEIGSVIGESNVYVDSSLEADSLDGLDLFSTESEAAPEDNNGSGSFDFMSFLSSLTTAGGSSDTGNTDDPDVSIEDAISEEDIQKAEEGLTLSDWAASEGTKLVALIDTGCNDLADTCVNLTSDADTDLNGHGTMMAKYVLYEAGPDIRLLSIKALGDDGKGNVSNIYAAVKYAIEAGADVINMSFSSRDAEDAEAFKEIVSSAVSAGITVVASAGNDGMNAVNYIPANIDGVITVGSCDSEGNIRDFSNYGSCVEYLVSSDSTSEAAARFTGMFCSKEDYIPDLYKYEYDGENVVLKKIGNLDFLVNETNFEASVYKNGNQESSQTYYSVNGLNGIGWEGCIDLTHKILLIYKVSDISDVIVPSSCIINGIIYSVHYASSGESNCKTLTIKDGVKLSSSVSGFDFVNGRSGPEVSYLVSNNNTVRIAFENGVKFDSSVNSATTLFKGESLVQIRGLQYLDFSQINSIFRMFVNTGIIEELDTNINVSNVSNMYEAFSGAKFSQDYILDLSSWDCKNVTNFYGFLNCWQYPPYRIRMPHSMPSDNVCDYGRSLTSNSTYCIWHGDSDYRLNEDVVIANQYDTDNKPFLNDFGKRGENKYLVRVLPSKRVNYFIPTLSIELPYPQPDELKNSKYYQQNHYQVCTLDSVTVQDCLFSPIMNSYGYSLLYWATNSDGTGTHYSPGDFITPVSNGSVVLYPVWGQAKSVTYYQGLASNITNLPEKQYQTGSSVTLATNRMTRTVAPSTTGYYTVTYDPNEGTCTQTSATASIVNSTTCTPDGWATTADGNKAYNNGQSVTLDADLDLYPYFKVEESTSVTRITLPTAAMTTRPGYLLKGWALDKNADTPDYISSYTPEKDIILYAVWERSSYLVHFDGNFDQYGITGINTTMEDQELSYDVAENLKENEFTALSWDFLEWNTEPDGSGVPYEDKELVENIDSNTSVVIGGGGATMSGEVTLYAQWKARVYTNHGSGKADIPIKHVYLDKNGDGSEMIELNGWKMGG